MIKQYMLQRIRPLLAVFALLFSAGTSWGQLSITTANTAVNQTFDPLAPNGTNNSIPTSLTNAGWSFLEGGSNANTTYSGGTGSSNTGDTYSFGVAGTNSVTDRAFGMLQSGNLTSILGFKFTNNTGSTVTSITVSYTGELWRLNSAGDVLAFSYQSGNQSLTATGYTAVSALEFTTPQTGTAAAVDGNATANRTTLSTTINVSIPNGTTYTLRWVDATAGSSAGMAIDDFSITLNAAAAPPALTAAANATVDAPFDVTFTDNATWRGAITGITVGGTNLSNTAYTVSTGKITFTPASSTLLQSSGSKAIAVIATGYSNATVSQTINPGAATKLAIGTQPAAPTANGLALATQPVITIQDQYSNTTTSTATVTAAVGAGTWTLGGTASVSAVSGTATFSGLTATSASAVTGATIAFSAAGLTGVTSGTFNIPAPAASIGVSPATLTGFNYVSGSGPSAAQTFTVSAANLTGAPGNLTVTGSTNYEVSTTSAITGFGSTATLAYTGASTLSSNTVWVRLKAGLAVGNYNSETITVGGGGAATNATVTVSGSVSVAPPANDLCANATTLTAGLATSGTMVGATYSTLTNEVYTNYATAGNGDVWFKYTPACAGTVNSISISTTGQDLDIEVFATSCPTDVPSKVASSYGTGTSSETVSNITVTGGTTYYIRVAKASGTSATFNITVTATNITPTLTLANTGTPAAGNVTLAATDVVLHSFSLAPNGCVISYNVSGVTVSTTGTATTSDFGNFEIVYDADNSGTYNAGDAIVSNAVSLAATMNFTLSGQTGLTATRRYLLIGMCSLVLR